MIFRYIVCHGHDVVGNFERLDDAKAFAETQVENMRRTNDHRRDTYVAVILHDDLIWSKGA